MLALVIYKTVTETTLCVTIEDTNRGVSPAHVSFLWDQPLPTLQPYWNHEISALDVADLTRSGHLTKA